MRIMQGEGKRKRERGVVLWVRWREERGRRGGEIGGEGEGGRERERVGERWRQRGR